MSTIKMLVSYKTPYGKYHTLIKPFKDRGHFQAWYKYMESKGYKLIRSEEDDTTE